MSRLIDADALYAKACDLEAKALSHVRKIANDETKIEEWRIWSAILAERTAFKHDVFDAHTIEPECKKGEWIVLKQSHNAMCSKCYQTFVDAYDLENWDNYCRHCGAVMESIVAEEEWDWNTQNT